MSAAHRDEPARVARLADVLSAAWGPTPRLALVLGSGLGPLETLIEPVGERSYADLPGLVRPSVLGHSGRLLWGTAAGLPLVLLCGRLHLYEGHSPDAVVRLARAVALAGVPLFLLTNAAGGIRSDLRPGVLMPIRDQINLQGVNPFLGPLRPGFGPRFPDQSALYDPQLLALLAANSPTPPGVYLASLAPAYETPAEIALGADAVGMSTAQEAMALSALGVRVGGLSIIANRAAGLGATALSHQEVLQVVAASAGRLADLLLAVLPSLSRLPERPPGP